MSYWKSALILALLVVAILTGSGLTTSVNAQSGLQQQPLQTPRDPEAEREAKHNLEVAKYYLKRKAYKAVSDRLLEITYVYPNFSRIDEVYSLLGETFIKLDNKGEAAKFYKKIVDEFPDSTFSKDAKKKLESLPAASETGQSPAATSSTQ